MRGLRQEGDLSRLALNLGLLGLTCALVGDSDGARAANAECIAMTEPLGECWYRAYSLWVGGLVAWRDGAASEARRLQDESLRLKRVTMERLGLGVSLEALAWLTAESDPSRAAVLVGATQSQWERCETSIDQIAGLSSFHAECMATIASALAEDQLEAALASGRAMAEPDAVDFALEATPAAAKGRRTASRTFAGALTRRETEVAELVTRGLSNQEIAERLVISKRTAETHVENILTKLGLTNRRQVAAWLAAQRSEAGSTPHV